MNPKFLCVTSIVLLAACSKNEAPVAPATNTASTTAAAAGKSVCDLKLIDAQDVFGVLNEQVVATKNLEGDPQTCKFSTAKFSDLTISLRPGHGVATLKTYSSGQMNEFEKSEPLPGVGDEAVRSLSLNRVIARKGDVLCEVEGPGLARPQGDPMVVKLGDLCNKVFSARAP